MLGCTRSMRAPLTNRTTRGVLVGAASGAVIGSVSVIGAPAGAVFGGVAGSIIGFNANNRVTKAQKLNEVLAQENIRIIEVGESFRILIPAQKIFVSKTPRQLPTAGAVYNLIARFIHRFQVVSIQIVGFTDDRGSAARNKGLSREWARTVMDQLILRGLDTRLAISEGYGESFPIVNNEKQARRARNNRIEIRFRRIAPPLML